MEPLYLGIDLSTQKLKAVVVNSKLEFVEEVSVYYDEELPEFGTTNGANVDPNNPHRITSPVEMWLKAVDLFLQKLKQSKAFDFHQIAGISGCAQQHGTVYWNKKGIEALEHLKSDLSLQSQLKDGFALENSPIWMDSSTTAECKQFEDCVEGAENLSKLTGSRAYHRFSGPQILKIFNDSPEVYHQSERISLISSFLSSLFVGKVVGIEVCDASGMNLMELRTKKWSDRLVNLVDGTLADKLGKIEDSDQRWSISHYHVLKYGFNPTCQVTAFTGDNPSALIGMGIKPGDMGISLGTSDTVFLTLDDYDSCLEGHIFVNPIHRSTFMGMLCFKNGSLVRERIRGERSWHEVSALLKQTPAGNNGNIGFYFDKHEILPNHRAGVFRFDAQGRKVDFFDAKTEIRAVFEHQCLAKRLYAEKFGFGGHQGRLILTGGASNNRDLQQMLANVFGRDSFVCGMTEAAAVGGALRAMPDQNHEISLERAAEPEKSAVEVYNRMIEVYQKLQSKMTKD